VPRAEFVYVCAIIALSGHFVWLRGFCEVASDYVRTPSCHEPGCCHEPGSNVRRATPQDWRDMGATFRFNCPRCGQTVTPEQKNCPKCNEQLEIPRSFQDALRKKAEGSGGTKQLSHPQAEPEPNADIRFNCPACGQHLSVEQRGAGSAVNCPTCNEQIEIPQGSTRPPPLPQSTS